MLTMYFITKQFPFPGKTKWVEINPDDFSELDVDFDFDADGMIKYAKVPYPEFFTNYLLASFHRGVKLTIPESHKSFLDGVKHVLRGSSVFSSSPCRFDAAFMTALLFRGKELPGPHCEVKVTYEEIEPIMNYIWHHSVDWSSPSDTAKDFRSKARGYEFLNVMTSLYFPHFVAPSCDYEDEDVCESDEEDEVGYESDEDEEVDDSKFCHLKTALRYQSAILIKTEMPTKSELEAMYLAVAASGMSNLALVLAKSDYTPVEKARAIISDLS